MSKRQNLYKAMEEISDEHIKETAQIKLKQQSVTEKGEAGGFRWRHAAGRLAAAACVVAVLSAATYNIWHQKNDMGDNQIPGAQQTGAGGTADAERTNAADAQIIWAQEGLTEEECQIYDGIYLEFENGMVMLLVENEGPVVISNWENIADQVGFKNFDIVRIYMAPGSAIQETYPAGMDIAGVSENKCGEARTSAYIEETLKILEEMGYVLKSS